MFYQKIRAGRLPRPEKFFSKLRPSDHVLLQVFRQLGSVSRNGDDDLDVGGDLIDGFQHLGGGGHVVVDDAQDAVDEQRRQRRTHLRQPSGLRG